MIITLPLLVACILGLSPGIANASTPHANNASAATLQQAEQDLEALFTVYLRESPTGTVSVNRETALRDGINLSDLYTIAKAINSPTIENSKNDREIMTPMLAFGSEKWIRCVVNFTGFGTIYGFLDGSLRADIRAKRFKRPALAIIRIVGASAVRGGAVGLVASLGAGATWCSTKWAN